MSRLRISAVSLLLALATGTLLLLLVILLLVASHRFGARFAGNQGWRRFASAVHLGLERLRHHPAAAANVLAVGFAYQLCLVLAALFAANRIPTRENVHVVPVLVAQAEFPFVRLRAVLLVPFVAH